MKNHYQPVVRVKQERNTCRSENDVAITKTGERTLTIGAEAAVVVGAGVGVGVGVGDATVTTVVVVCAERYPVSKLYNYILGTGSQKENLPKSLRKFRSP